MHLLIWILTDIVFNNVEKLLLCNLKIKTPSLDVAEEKFFRYAWVWFSNLKKKKKNTTQDKTK